MKRYKIPLSVPYITPSDRKEVERCLSSTWISSKSAWVGKFEEAFARKVSKTKYALATNSCTSSLFVALKVLGIGKGDEVILPTFTMIATINAVVLAGAKPVLVDSTSINDWNINPQGIKKAITKKTKAIIPVHIYGFPADMDAILKIAKKHKIFVIEDAAEAMGSFYKGKKVGSMADVSCFSLYANKVITAGNGGVLATNSQKIYYLAKKLSFFDFGELEHFWHKAIGYNFVLSGLQAALALSQVRRFETMVDKRIKIRSWWEKHLDQGIKKFLTPGLKGDRPCFWFPTMVFPDHKTKEKVKNTLEANGVETRDFFRPLHLQPAYKEDYKRFKFPNSEYFFERGLLLPSFYELKEKEIAWAAGLINKVIA